MSRVDGQLMRIYEESTKSDSLKGKKVSEEEALRLIRCAEKINSNATGSCFTSSDARGSKHLERLLKHHKDEFSKESRLVIKNYLQSGHVPLMSTPVPSGQPSSIGGGMPVPSHGRPHGGGHLPIPTFPNANGTPVPPSAGHSNGNSTSMPVPPSPSRPSGNSGSMPVPPSPSRPSGNGGSMPVPPSPSRPSGNGGGAPVLPPSSGPVSGNNPGASAPSVIPPNVPPLGVPVSGGVDNNHGVEGPHGVEILNWKADKATEHFHWFPLQETQPNGGDATNNLYAPRGALAKYDAYTGMSKAREYEFEHNRKAVNAGAEFGWWGHCDKAATAACVLQAPKHDVILTNEKGEKVRFTKNDIQGLCVKVVSNLAEKVDFRGNRYNGGAKDDPNDPLPDVFISVMKEWSRDKLPFVLDIDPGTQVWNFPYDQVKIYESTKAPAGFNAANMPNDGSVKYYHIEMMGTGYPEKARVYESFVQTDANGKTVKSGWIKTPSSHKNPDFMWRPHPVGDLRDKSLWVNHGKVSNPEIDPQVVYDIYMKSLA